MAAGGHSGLCSVSNARAQSAGDHRPPGVPPPGRTESAIMNSKTSRFFMKTRMQKVLLLIVISGVLLLGGGYAGYRGYKSARQIRLVKQARVYLAKPDPR